jgi:hypothetical protein
MALGRHAGSGAVIRLGSLCCAGHEGSTRLVALLAMPIAHSRPDWRLPPNFASLDTMCALFAFGALQECANRGMLKGRRPAQKPRRKLGCKSSACSPARRQLQGPTKAWPQAINIGRAACPR